MWTDTGEDPGGGPSNQELSDLKDQCEQQQVLIAQLKEILRKNEQTNVTQEKVDEYMNTLTRMNARVKKSKRKDLEIGRVATVDIPAKSKIDLLRQQVAENRAKLAERDKSQKGIEEMVTQIQAQLDDSQQWINQTPLNLSLQDTNKIEYSQNSSSEELYNILLIKEKRITELVNKTQKLESNILDLQENLKEKDSVIDARTKAITLMTENLSRKSKGTLDALDETKEQMRKMQENFVSLESEMKARQMKLLDDLRLKNYEIAELQEVNSKLQQELSDKTHTSELNQRIQQLEELNQQLQQKVSKKTSKNSKNNELQEKFDSLQCDYEKLTITIKEKDDCIENLQKSLKNLENQQIKEDSDELIKLKKQLDENNKNMIKIKAQSKSKIKELTRKLDDFKKIDDINAELVKFEAENCKLNQKIAELEEEKGSLQLKLMETDRGLPKEIEEEIETKDQLIEAKSATISTLENEITTLKTEMEILTEKLNNSPSFEHVRSEMTSIQFEEQLDELRKENQQNLTIIQEKDEKIELLLKEKQELSLKLENYIQENIELIDKLEKLSAEKVSSAESIEIVENLTQQEKLELEAYQKTVENPNNRNNLKASDENLPQVDLNESVNELNEETSELLQKIQLFTIERREVMEKMEQLKHENNNLVLKMNEIENNRDILAETYEHLQNEKDDLLRRFDVIQQENEKLKNNEKKIDELLDENQHLLMKLEENERLRNEQQNLEIELNQIKQINDELIRDVDNYKKSIDEMNNLTDSIQQVREQLELTIEENRNLKMRVEELENNKNDLDKQIEKYHDDLETIEWENRKLLENKDNEIGKLIKERDNLQNMIENLQTAIQTKDENYSKLHNELKEKYLQLQKQLQENSDNFKNMRPLEQKIDELTNKNKEQLDKMKKIAANLKKKTQAYQELQDEYKLNQEKWVNETQEKDLKITTLVQQLQELEEIFTEKTQQLEKYESRNVELQNTIIELRTKLERATEINLQQELLQTKENIIDIESNENLLKSKIQELEMLLETKENDLLKSNERITKLEEDIRFVEERRMSLEKRTNELGVQLEEKQQNYDEITKNKDLLEQRLIALVEHDEIIEKKLEISVQENVELNQQILELNQINGDNNKKFEELQNKLERLENYETMVDELENSKQELLKIKQNLENDLKNLQNDHKQITQEFEKVNNDWQQQFDEMFKEKNELMARCERLEDELKQIHDKNSSFNDELNFYKNKLENNEVEIRHYEEQIQQLLNENQKHIKLDEEINDLKQQHMEKLQEIELLRNECEQLRNKVDKNVENQTIVEEKIPTIVWSDQGNDPFDFLSNQNRTIVEEKIVPIQGILQPQQQDLPQKIKTLEFMLFNAEKERDDALTQCQQLTNELTRFVYDKISTEQLESQILSNDQLVENKENLQKLEYEPIKQHAIDQGGIDEEKCERKSAYRCYPNQSINEDVVKNEIATVSTTTKRDTFGESEDGWGWSPEDIQLEEQHNNNIDLLKERINVLEIERNQHLEEIKQLQIKSGKLIKKLKELKLKNDELQRTKKLDDFGFNLDDTIQEEFKLQIQQIERKLNETINDLEKERYEKQSLQKRCDLLITTNERMIEMKEKHEIELLGWQQNCRELNAKLERYEWGQDDGFIINEPTKIDTNIDDNDNGKEINQLNETIKELTLDNDELQKLLEEQRQLRIDAEKVKIIDNTTEITTKLDESLRTIQLIEIENAGKTKIIEKLQETIKELSVDNENLQKLLEEQRQLRIEAKQTTEEYDLLKKQIDEKMEIIERLEGTIKQLSLDNEQLQKLLEEQRQLRIELEQSRIVAQANEADLLTNQIDELTAKLDESLQKIESIQNENIEQTTIVQQLNDKIVEYQKDKNDLLNDLQIKDIEINSIKIDLEKLNRNYDETIQLKQNEILQLTNQIQQHTDEMNLLNNEWQLRVDQRGNDVAESWKLHIDSRENEFKQIEDDLRKEMIDIEEKCNALMNENNELRKNVDIEIRNEVDRINNLQQQINERQHIINDLTNTIQMKQLEIERVTSELQQKQQLIENILEKFHIDNESNSILLDCEKFYKDFENNCLKLEEIERRELLLQQEIQQKNDMITNLTQQLQHIQSLKEYENENVENLQQNLVEFQQINATINAQLQDKSKLYENLRRELQERNNELDEIKQQNNVLINEQLQEIDLLKRRLIDDDELSNQKTNNLLNLQQQLNEKSNEIVVLQQKINEQNQLLSDEDKQLLELRNIIEEQVMKIENLKTELYEKSNDYDSLIAEMDMSRMNEHQKIKEEYRQQQQQNNNNNKDDDLSDPVSRAELDLALYMLHQRDVRCEELTVELTQLLEERDTLQLRLSNALREKEEIYKRLKIVDGNEDGSSTDPTTMNLRTSTITTTGDDSILAGSSERTIKDNQLDNKISELKTVGYKRDKTIVDEQDLRRLQQLSILQQHKDAAAKLPAEAAARLVDASYTLSRDVQSPSKVLLNWLWGKSTPKVNDI